MDLARTGRCTASSNAIVSKRIACNFPRCRKPPLTNRALLQIRYESPRNVLRICHILQIRYEKLNSA
jgi:hypothetical protein